MKYIYKYRDLSDDNDYTLDALEKGYLYFSYPDELNDPYDCDLDLRVPKTIPEAEFFNQEHRGLVGIPAEDNIQSDDDVARRTKDWENIVKRSLIICSFCKSNNIIKVWSHYTNSHKGLCLGFNIFKPKGAKKKYLKFKPNQIHTDFPLHNGGLFDLNPVVYDSSPRPLIDYTTMSKQTADELLMRSWYTKSKDWEEEEEFRIILPAGNQLMKKDQKIEYDPSILDHIIFGLNTSKEKILSVLDITTIGYPFLKYYHTAKSSDPYKLEIKSLDISKI